MFDGCRFDFGVYIKVFSSLGWYLGSVLFVSGVLSFCAFDLLRLVVRVLRCGLCIPWLICSCLQWFYLYIVGSVYVGCYGFVCLQWICLCCDLMCVW